jgi:DtxR family transcriptional regulator, manganese transport regulator
MNRRPDSLSVAEVHRKTRSAHATETAEDYVEAIDDIVQALGACRVVDLTRRFGVTHVTVTRIIQRLQRQELVVAAPRRAIALTASGKALATQARRRHQIVLDFLLSLGVSRRTARIDAEGIEHHVSAETLRLMDRVTRRSSRSEPVRRRKESQRKGGNPMVPTL